MSKKYHQYKTDLINLVKILQRLLDQEIEVKGVIVEGFTYHIEIGAKKLRSWSEYLNYVQFSYLQKMEF